jgi:hypothetical protein
LVSALKVTTLASIFAWGIFAVVTQILAASGAISLSTTMQLTMWLVALGFIVLLAIAYLLFRIFEHVYEIAMSSQEGRTWDAGAMGAPAPVPPANGNPNDGAPRSRLGRSRDGSTQKAEDGWVPPDELRQLDGSEYSVSMEEVFPDGCYLDSITQVSGKSTGQQVYECRVVDRNPALKDRPHETVVKILADQMPPPASIPRFGWVEFENLAITPYLTDRNPMGIRYSLCATGLHPAAAPTGREQATWSVPPLRAVPSEELDVHAGTEDAPNGAAGTN